MNSKFAVLPKIEISWGEYFDRLSILEIKLSKISDRKKLNFIEESLNSLVKSGLPTNEFPEEVQILYQKLKHINRSLWDIEDSKRECERNKDFGPEFVSFSRSVYINNDTRAKFKLDIDLILDSRLIEVKSHNSY